MTIPLLTTERLTLRPFTLADAPAVVRLLSDREVAKTLTVPFPYGLRHAREWIASHAPAAERSERFAWAITAKEADRLMGAIELRVHSQPHVGELGYWLGRDFWGQGYMTEAAQAVLAYGFREVGLYRIQAKHWHNNPASGRVMQKIGMTYEGTLRAATFRWGEYLDVLVYAVLRDERTEGLK